MPTQIPNFYTINGVIDTSKSVLENMNLIAEASGCWMTYDIHQGKWAVVINNTGSSVASFNTSNIIGGVNVSSTSLTEVYNSVEMEFPHQDLNDLPDLVIMSVPEADRYPNEPDNVLRLTSQLINNQAQAQSIAARQLKQSRVDKVINFSTTYTYIGLKAGELIDITLDVYGWASKVFRITSISEEDADDGNILVSITAMEYSADVYSPSGLNNLANGLQITPRDKTNGILPVEKNTATQTSDDQATGIILQRLLASTALTGLVNMAFSRNPATGVLTQILKPASAERESVLMAIKKPGVTITGASSVCEGATLSLTLALDCDSCLYENFSYDYSITGVQAADITFPLTGTVTVPGSMSIPIAADASAENETLTLTIGSQTKVVTINESLAYTYVTTANPTSITEGATSTVTLTTTGLSDGTTVPYTITGAAVNRVTTPLSGTVTVNSNTASLTVTTTDDSVYTGTQNLTVTFNSAQADPCNQLDKTATITVLDNDAAPPADYSCNPITIPAVWCGVADGTTNQIKSLQIISTIQVCSPVPGQPSVTVPTAVSVTQGNPSTITVTATATVNGLTGTGGTVYEIITNFDPMPAGQTVTTGTKVNVIGF